MQTFDKIRKFLPKSQGIFRILQKKAEFSNLVSLWSLTFRGCLLSEEIVSILRKSIDQGGTTLRDFVGSDNKPGYFKQQLEVYGRQGKECKICASTLKNKIIGQRSSVFCPKCQK